MKRQDHNRYVLHDDYAECFVYNIKHELIGSFLIDLEDVEKCKKHRWWLSIGKNNYKRVATDINDKKITLHRYVLNYDENLHIDHINRNALDNRKSNLRIVSAIENNNNKNGKNADPCSNGKFKCVFIRYGMLFYLGYFNTAEEAKIAKQIKITEIEENKEYYLSEYKRKAGEKIKGVTITPSGKWRADVVRNGKIKRIGTFNTKEEAAKAREEYLIKLEA